MAVEKEIKDQKIWKSTCEWMKENVLENAKAFTDDVKNLLNEAVVGKIKGWLDNSKALQLYKYQTLTVDDIFQELAGILDQDACSYLRYAGPKNIKALRKISVCSVFAEKAKGCKLNKFDIQYINNVFAELSQEEINRTVSFLENAVSDQIVAENSEALKFLKNLYQQKSHFNRIHKIFDSARQAAEVKGGPLTEVEARYINRTYADSGKQKIPQGEIDSYFKIISKGYDVSDLKNVGSQFDQDTLEHIFAGQLKGKAKGKVEAVGYHYVGEQDTVGSIIPGTKTPKNKFGGYEAKVKVAGIKKRDISSFYPDSMSRQDVVDVINQAYANMTLQPEGHYIGTAMYQGNKMTIVIRLKANGKIETAYPKY